LGFGGKRVGAAKDNFCDPKIIAGHDIMAASIKDISKIIIIIPWSLMLHESIFRCSKFRSI